MKKFFKVIGGLLISVILLSSLAVLVLPRLLDLQAIRSYIQKEIGLRLKAQVKIDSLRITLIPHPGVRLEGLEVKTAKYHLFVPHTQTNFALIPLIHQRFEIEKLILKRPIMEINLRGQKGSLEKYLKTLKTVLHYVPLINLSVEGGQLWLKRQGIKFFEVNQIFLRADMQPKQVLITLTGHSKIFKTFSLDLKYWPSNDFIEGGFSFRHLNLAQLNLSSQTDWLTHLKTDLSLQTKFRREEQTWYIGFKASAPCFLRAHHPDLLFSCTALLGEIRLSPEKKWVRLDQIVMKDPTLVGSGNLTLTPKEAFLFVKIDQGDFGAWRQSLSFLASKNKGLKHLFNIVQKGKIEKATIQCKAPTWKELGHLGNITISAKARAAQIDLPFLRAPLEVNQGHVRLFKRTLLVEKASGHYKQNLLEDTKLELYLFDRDQSFLFESKITATASDVVEVLRDLLKKSTYISYLEKIKNVHGRLKGLVRVDGTLNRPSVFFDVYPLELSGRYTDFPLPLTLHRGELTYTQKVLTFKALDLALEKSHLQNVSGSVTIGSKPLTLKLKEVHGVLAVDEINTLLDTYKIALGPDKLLAGTIQISEASYQGKLAPGPLKQGLYLKAKAQDVKIKIKELPDTLWIKTGDLRFERGNLSFGPAKITILDTQGVVSGAITKLFQEDRDIALEGEALVGKSFLDWLWREYKIPYFLYPLSPLKAHEFTFQWNHKVGLVFEGQLENPKGVIVSLSLRKKGPLISLSPCRIKINRHQIEIGLLKDRQRLSLSFQGKIKDSEWDLLFPKPLLRPAFVKGHFKGVYYPGHLLWSRFQGQLTIRGLKTSVQGVPIYVVSFRSKGQGSRGYIREIKALLDHTQFTASGSWELAPRNIRLSGNLKAPIINLTEIIKKLKNYKKKGPSTHYPHLVLNLDLQVDQMTWEKYHLNDITANLLYFKDTFRFIVEKADFCGLNVVGELLWSPYQQKLRLSYFGAHKNLHDFLTCSLGRDKLAQGTFTLEGTFQGFGKKGPFLDKTAGKFAFSSPEGRLFKIGMLVKLFAFLNPLEVFQGNLPNLSQEGLHYDLLEIKGHFQKHYLLIDTAQIKATGLRIFASGKIDLLHKKIQLTALVSPFIQADKLVSHIPLVGWVLTGKSKTFFSIPVGIHGSLDKPEIFPLDPQAVSQTLLGILKRTLQLPVKVFIPSPSSPPLPNEARPKGESTPPGKQ